MLAHYTNTQIETCSLFADSSVNNVLLQTNTDFTSHFLKFINSPDTLLQDSQTLQLIGF